MSNGVLGAMGIGVSDLARSTDFYTRVLGMEQIGRLRLPEMDEIMLAYDRARGPALVLMHHTDGREVSYADLPVKVVVYVADPASTAAAIRADGLAVWLDARGGAAGHAQAVERPRDTCLEQQLEAIRRFRH